MFKTFKNGYVALQLAYAIFFKKLKPFSRKLNSKNNGLFCYLRLFLGIETVSCRLLQRMTRMDMD